jgi:hypothetical protein
MASKAEQPAVPVVIESQLNSWTVDQNDMPQLLAQTARSLDTVTKLTQYEDEKANRLLTAIAFLSAFVATLFATIPNRFPPGSIDKLWNEGLHVRSMLLESDYGLFCLYAVLVSVGVSMILYGVQPRFNLPKVPTSKKGPKSLLFYRFIIETVPEEWGKAFSGVSSHDLEMQYVKNSIVETYLVAQKIPVKIKWVTRGVRCFLAAALVVTVLACSIVVTLVTTAAP